MLNQAIRSIIDLLKLKKDARKTDLEIDKLEREKRSSESMIHIASNEDIRKYDPRVNRLEFQLEQQRREPSFAPERAPSRMVFLVGIFLVLCLVGLGVYLVMR